MTTGVPPYLLTDPQTTLSAEEVGFEPTVPRSGTPVFETGPFNHSGTPPGIGSQCLTTHKRPLWRLFYGGFAPKHKGGERWVARRLSVRRTAIGSSEAGGVGRYFGRVDQVSYSEAMARLWAALGGGGDRGVLVGNDGDDGTIVQPSANEPTNYLRRLAPTRPRNSFARNPAQALRPTPRLSTWKTIPPENVASVVTFTALYQDIPALSIWWPSPFHPKLSIHRRAIGMFPCLRACLRL